MGDALAQIDLQTFAMQMQRNAAKQSNLRLYLAEIDTLVHRVRPLPSPQSAGGEDTLGGRQNEFKHVAPRQSTESKCRFGGGTRMRASSSRRSRQ